MLTAVLRAALRQRGAGCIADAPDPAAHGWDPLVGAAPLPPDWNAARGLEAYLPTIYDQGATNSCVANAFALAIGIVETVLGLPYEPVSRRDVYYRSRFADKIKGDLGSRIATTARVVRKWGAALEEDVPFSSIRIDKPPPASALMDGFERSGLVYERIFATGNQLLAELVLATQQGRPVVFGGPLVKRYYDHRGSGTLVAPKAGETITGRHAQVLVRFMPDGRPRIANSWGRAWGDGGLAYWSADYLLEHCRDFTVIRDWRRAQQAVEARRAA